MQLRKKEAPAERPPLSRLNRPHTEGLNESEVYERVQKGYVNTPVSSPTKTVRQIIASNVLTYFNLIFFVLAALLIIVGAFNHLTFLGVVFVNMIIGIIQEINSKKTLDRLTLMSEPRATVVREGRSKQVLTEELVVDDIIRFAAGNQICADAVLVEGELQVNESLVTGEADEIIKHPGDTLLSGSFVVAGSGHARLERVGSDSFVSRLTLDAKQAKKRQQPGMMRSLTRLVQIIGIIIIPMGIALFVRQSSLLGLDTKSNVEATTAALIGMIPEGLYLLANVALAAGVIKLARKKTLVHELKCIETLARVDVLCVDKTGTITDDRMCVNGVVPLPPMDFEPEVIEGILGDFTGNMSADNATMAALKEHFARSGCRRATAVVPFTSRTKTSAAAFGAQEAYLLGAPEFVLGNRYQSYRSEIETYTQQGSRVLLLAMAERREDGAFLCSHPIALVLMTNNIRPDAKETFAYFEEQGVAVKVISGDNPLTAAAAARAAGIPKADSYIDLSTIKDDEQLRRAALEYTIFGRVTPDQKRKLVQILKKAGHTVAMTGDGVNDVLALKEADCSIAMASGSDVACQVSNLVLLDSNFASLPSVVAEGRQVINNIERSASLFLVKNIFSFVLSLISIFAVFAYPLTPSQISLVSMCTIGIPAFFLALERNENLIRGHFLRNVMFRALPAALTDLLVIVGVLLFAKAFNISADLTSTLAALLMAVVGFAMLLRICRPFNVWRVVLLLLLAVLYVLALIILPVFFAMTALDLGCGLIFVVFTLLIPSVMFVFSLGLDRLSDALRRVRTKLPSRHRD